MHGTERRIQMFNLVVLTGRLTADPELKTTQSGIPVTSFSIAVNRNYKAGEEQLTDFINIVAWRNTAEFISKYFKKGALIGIEGSIQTRKYTDKDGNNRTAFEVIASNVQFVEPKTTAARTSEDEVAEPNGVTDTSNFTETDDDGDLPF